LREITRMVRELEDAEEKYDVARINERVGMNATDRRLIQFPSPCVKKSLARAWKLQGG